VEFIDRLSSVTKSVIEKTTGKVEITKLNVKINSINTSIAAQKAKIGEYYWSKLASGEPCPPELTETHDIIKNYIGTLVTLQAEKQALIDRENELKAAHFQTQAGNVTAACPFCGTQNEPDSAFCFACGKNMASAAPVVENEAEKTVSDCCASCGAEMLQGAMFCPQCGTRRQQG
jgi:hypothetical protein